MLKIPLFAFLPPSAFALRFSYLHFRRITPSLPLRYCTNCTAADTWEKSAALSDISRATTPHFVSIQRLAPSLPPAISAEVLQFLQLLH